MQPFGFTRTAVQRDHAFIAPDSHVTGPLPRWEQTGGVVLISPRMGAGFTQFLAHMDAGGRSGAPLRAAALPQQDAASAPAPLAPPQPRGVELDSKPPRVYEHANGAQPVFRDTMPMSVTDLMGLPPMADDEPDDDPWGSRRRGA